MGAEKKITTGEVVGHLRAAARLFKSFEFANEAAQTVLTAESSVKKLEKEVELLKKERDTLNKECDKLVERSNEAEKAIAVHKEAVAKAAQEAIETANANKLKASKEAKAIVDRAEAKAKQIEDKIAQSLHAASEATKKQGEAETELEKIVAQIDRAKKSFIKNFGS